MLRAEGKPRAALAALDPILQASPELGITYLHVKLGFIEALEAAFALGDLVKVDELLGIIEALRPGERPPPLEAQAYRFRAQSGEEAGFATAETKFLELDMPFWLAPDGARARRVANRRGSLRRNRAAAREGARDLRTARGDALARAHGSCENLTPSEIPA